MERIDSLFWTDILTDHAMFLINAFSPREDKYIENAEKFHYIFKKYNQAIASGQDVDMNTLKEDTEMFVAFKKCIIRELLLHNIMINFSPSFINHMVNEADEFLSLFHTGVCPEKTKIPALYIKTWLADAYGHASTLAGLLDLAETLSIQQAEFFMTIFDKLEKKASEMEMISQNLKSDIDVSLLKSETIDSLEEFINYSANIGELLDCKKIMSAGTLSSDITNHFIKEHKYFIQKLRMCT